MTERQPSGSPLNPTFRGYIATTMDALVLFEACLSGRLSHVPRRPHDRERSALIRSGHVFIYEEHSSGIKRWTDGVPWSPSRILGNFLLYRELDKPFQPGEKKRAMKKPKVEGGVSKPSVNPPAPRAHSISSYGTSVPSNSSLSSYENGGSGRDSERALVGSLVDSYQFKSDGLIKKTISVSYRGVQHHLVSYYNIDDVISGRLSTPSATPDFKNLTPRSSLISSGNFRAPVDDHELVVDHGQMAYLAAAYNPYIPEYVSMNGINHRSMSVPLIHQQYQSWGGMPQQHSLNTNYTMTGSPAVPISPGVYQAPSAAPPIGYGYSQGTQQHHLPPPQHQHTHQQPSSHPPPPHAHQNQEPHAVQQHYNHSLSRRQAPAPGNPDGLGFAAMLDGHGPPGVSIGYDPSHGATNGTMDSDLGIWAGAISEADHKF